ncbi:MAG: sulfotransferase [Methylococcales bacterium]
MQLIVLGMHRTGTSVLAGLLNLMGAYFGPPELSIPANDENKKGFWERQDVVDLNQETLQSCGADWFKVSNLNLNTLSNHNRFRTEARRIVRDMDQRQSWVMKDPRLCLLFPLWKEFLKSPVCLHTYRTPIETADSLRVRNGFPIHTGIALWEKYNLDALAASSNLPRLLVHYRDLLESPVEVVRKLYNELCSLGVRSLNLPEEAEICSFVDSSLYRSRINESIQAGYLNSQQDKLNTAFENRSILSWPTLPSLSSGALESLTLLEANDTIKSRNLSLEYRVEELDELLLAQKGWNRQLKERIEELDDSLLARTGQNRQLKERIEELDAVVLAQKGQNQQLEKRIEELDASLLTSTDQNQQLERKIEDLDASQLALTRQNRQLTDRNEELDASLLRLTGRNLQLEGRIGELDALLLAQKGSNRQLGERIEELDASQLALTGQNRRITDRNEELDASLLRLTGRNLQLEGRIEELDASLLARIGRNRQLEEQIQELNRAKEELNCTRESQKKQIEIVKAKIAELIDSIRNLEIERTSLYNSTSWKIANTLVKVAEKLTFR